MEREQGERTMSITVFPGPHVAEMTFDLDRLGYDLIPRQLSSGEYVMDARPRGPVATNSNIRHFPKYRRQYRGATPDGGPDAAA
jgi:hypothetical protein